MNQPLCFGRIIAIRPACLCLSVGWEHTRANNTPDVGRVAAGIPIFRCIIVLDDQFVGPAKQPSVLAKYNGIHVRRPRASYNPHNKR